MEERKDLNEALRSTGIDGFVRFSIKAENTESNVATHNGFKEFCRVETGNNFTLGLRKLLENWQGDFKYEMLWEAIRKLEQDNLELRNALDVNEKKEEEEEAF